MALGNRIDAEEHYRYCNVVQTPHARAVMTVGLANGMDIEICDLYGLPTAGAVFAMNLQTKLLGVGFKQSTHDRSVY